MIVRAVVLPGTPLLVPGAAGAASVLVETRAAVLAALADLVHGLPATAVDGGTTSEHGSVVVVAPGGARSRGPARASLTAVGVDDAWLDPAWAVATIPEDGRVAGPTASVGLLALAAAGWSGSVEVVEVDDLDASAAHALGADLAREGARLVVVDDPRSRVPGVVLDGFGAARYRVRTSAATGEYEGRPYEVRRYEEDRPASVLRSVSR